MISQLLKRRLVSEKVALLVARAVVLVCAVLIVGYAFIQMAMLPLTETQWFVGLAIVTALVLQCVIVAALIDLRRKSVEPGGAAKAASPRR